MGLTRCFASIEQEKSAKKHEKFENIAPPPFQLQL
jgi:hypothetical protein